MAAEPKFEECRLCVNFKYRHQKKGVCRSCGTGEHFEEKLRELDVGEQRMNERMMRKIRRDEE